MPIEADPDIKFGRGLSNLEYAHLAEIMGQSVFASEVRERRERETERERQRERDRGRQRQREREREREVNIIFIRYSIAVHQTLVIWKYWFVMELKNRMYNSIYSNSFDLFIATVAYTIT